MQILTPKFPNSDNIAKGNKNKYTEKKSLFDRKRDWSLKSLNNFSCHDS